MAPCFSYAEPVQFNIEVTEPGSDRIGEELTDYVLAQRVQVGNGSSLSYNLVKRTRHVHMYCAMHIMVRIFGFESLVCGFSWRITL